MQKLLTKFRQTQSAKDALRLLAYLDKHPFGVVLASVEDQVVVETLREKRARAIHAVHCARAA
jgi:hypothetical protein